MEQNRIFDIIINLLIGIKNQNRLIDQFANKSMTLNDCSYLLNQTIRQYQLPRDHYFVSEKAQELWNKISSKSIFNYKYRDKITKNIEGQVEIRKFRGGERDPYEIITISAGDSFVFKDVFTEEHIVTVSNIIEELLALPEYTYDAIQKVLDKLYICVMLKDEDRSIKNKKNRSTDYRKVIAFDYQRAEITVLNFDYQSVPEVKQPELEMAFQAYETEQAKICNVASVGTQGSMTETLGLTNAENYNLKFWTMFNEYAFKNPVFDKEFKMCKATMRHWYNFDIGNSDCHIAATHLRDRLCIEMYIQNNKALFDHFFLHKSEIEAIIGRPLEWKRLPEKKASRILATTSQFDMKDESLYEKEFDWIIEYTFKFKKAFTPFCI